MSQSFLYKREAPLSVEADHKPMYPRVHECTPYIAGYMGFVPCMEYPESFNGYSLVSEHIMAQVKDSLITKTIVDACMHMALVCYNYRHIDL